MGQRQAISKYPLTVHVVSLGYNKFECFKSKTKAKEYCTSNNIPKENIKTKKVII